MGVSREVRATTSQYGKPHKEEFEHGVRYRYQGKTLVISEYSTGTVTIQGKMANVFKETLNDQWCPPIEDIKGATHHVERSRSPRNRTDEDGGYLNEHKSKKMENVRNDEIDEDDL